MTRATVPGRRAEEDRAWSGRPGGVVRLAAKRGFDLAAAGVGVLVTLPIQLVIAILVKAEDGGPILYRGERVGRYGRAFRMLKFRTMVPDAERRGASSTADDDPRITRIGRVLRRFKLDELPQLWNVLLGDMSVVGPRPQVRWAVELYRDEERHLLDVRPGITDYASIRFRNEGEILRGNPDPDRTYLEKIAPEKTRLGLLYVHTHSIGIDLRIIAATMIAVAGGDPERILGLDRSPTTPDHATTMGTSG